MFKPRWYQETGHNRIMDILDAKGHPLLLLATGTGKTEVAAMVINTLAKKNKSVLFLAHRGFLLDQADTKIKKHTNKLPSREQGRLSAEWKGENITASLQTLKGKRLAAIDPESIDYIIIDECHRSTSDSYQKIFKHFSKAQRIGLTATGDRPDGKSLMPTFSEIALNYSLSQAVKECFLSRIIGRRVENFDIDLSGLSISDGDFSNEDEIGDLIETKLIPIAENIIHETKERQKVLLFMPNVHSSKLIAETLQAMGVSADYVSGDRDDNNQVLARFKSGEIKFLASCMLLIEGYDEPGIDCVVMLRPTASRILYSQAVGRGTRLFPGKTDLLLLEFTFNSDRLELVTAFELMADNFDAEMIEEAKRSRVQDEDFLESLEELKKTFYSVSKILDRSSSSSYEFKSFNPLDINALLETDINSETEAWFNGNELTGQATKKQKELLHRYMINSDNMTKAAASSILSKLMDEQIYPSEGLVSSKQLDYMKKICKKPMPGHITKAAASLIINRQLNENKKES